MSDQKVGVDHFDYPELGLSIDRGKVGDPSIVTLDWIVVDDDDERLRKLTLGCDLLIDTAEGVRELSVVSVGGDSDAIADFRRYVTTLEIDPLGSEIKDDGDADNDRMHDVAVGLGRALLLNDAKDRFPSLFMRVLS